MRESRREVICSEPRRLPRARLSAHEVYLRGRLTEPGRTCTTSDSRGAGMLRKDIFSRLTLVAGFPTPSERLLRPYATRAQAGHERSCCQRPARFCIRGA